MGLITRQYVFANGTQANADYVNYEFDTLVQLVNGQLDSDNIASLIGSKIQDGSITAEKLGFAVGVLNDLAPSLTGTYSSEKVDILLMDVLAIVEANRDTADTDLAQAIADFTASLDLKADKLTTYTKTETNTLLQQFDDEKADKVDTYTKTETDTLLNQKVDSASVYSQSEVDDFLLTKANTTDVYNKTETDLEIADLIDDVNPASSTKVYSGLKVEQLIAGGGGSGGGSSIDDANPSLISTYSSSKIEQELANTLQIDDLSSSVDTVYSSAKTDELYAPTGDYLVEADLSVKENNIFIANDEDIIDPELLETGQKFLQNRRLKYINEEVAETVSYPNFPVASFADLTAQGWTMTQNQMYNWSTLGYRVFDGNTTTSARVNAVNGWFAVEFATPIRMQDIIVNNNVPNLIVEASIDGVVYETATNINDMGSTKADETYRLISIQNIKKVRFTFPTYNISENVAEISFLAVGETSKVINTFELGDAPRQVIPAGIDESLADNSAFINQALQDYRSVRIPAGTWKIQNPILIPSNTHLEIEEGAEILRNSNTLKVMVINDSNGTVGGWDANSNIHISGKGTINGNYSTFADKDFGGVVFAHTKESSIRGITFKNWTSWHQVEINSSKQIKIIDVKFKDYLNSASATEALQIDGSFSSAQLPFIQGQPYDSTMCQDIEIRDCLFSNVHHAIGSHSSALNKVHRKIKVVNNQFFNLSGYTITALNWEDVDVQDNLVESAKYGFYLYLDGVGTNSGRIRVKNNRLFNIGNSAGVYDNVARAIQISSSSVKANGRFSNVFIEGNIISLVGRHGIGFDYGERVFVRGNSVENIYHVGIWSYGATGVVIEGNNVDKCNVSVSANTQAIKVGASGGATAEKDTGVIVMGNRFSTIGIEQTDKVSFINNIYNTGGTYLPATNTNFVNTGNIQV